MSIFQGWWLKAGGLCYKPRLGEDFEFSAVQRRPLKG
jgi:hypothetical protein